MLKKTEKLNQNKFVKGLVMAFVGAISYPGLAIFNKMKIEGTEHIKDLPKKNVLFISNHQTYFAEVIAILHVFCAVKWGKKNKLGIPYYLIAPFTHAHFVSAAENDEEELGKPPFCFGGCHFSKKGLE